MVWFTYWHIVAALVLLTVALIYLAYRLEVWTEADFHREDWYLTGGAPPGCLPLILACLSALAVMAMVGWKFILWIVT